MIAMELLVLAFCAAVWAPDTRIGKILRSALIDVPAKRFARTTPLRLVIGFLVFVSLSAFAFGAPEWIALFGLGDLALYLDVGFMLLVTSVVVHLRVPLVRALGFVRSRAGHLVATWGRVNARRRLRRVRKIKAPPSDEADGSIYGWACANTSQLSLCP